MKCLLERLNHMKSSRKLLVGKLREAEESNRRKSRIITQFEREQKESKVRIEIDVKIAADDARTLRRRRTEDGV